jgi:hypothetical protein
MPHQRNVQYDDSPHNQNTGFFHVMLSYLFAIQGEKGESSKKKEDLSMFVSSKWMDR